jgi:glycosyltransferase involved in cell wall biosynthesis
MTVIVAQLGARMHYAVPRLLHTAGMLERLYTDICAVKGWPQFLCLLSPRFVPVQLRRLQGRVPIGIPPKKIIAFTQFGYEYWMRRHQTRSAHDIIAVHLWASDRFNELVVDCGFGTASMVYGFNSASEGMLQIAKASHLLGVVEQTSAPYLVERRILSEAAAAFPEGDKRFSDENVDAFAAREQREWALADRILVPSEFVKQQISEVDGPVQKCRVVPYGVEQNRFAMAQKVDSSKDRNGILRVLFVGKVSLQKGVHYLLEAMRQLRSKAIQCRIVGGLEIDRSDLNEMLPQNVELVGSIPRNAIHKEYAWADVFCLPSLCEGSATVVYEALAAGLPVVTTPNSGSIVRDGVEGFVIPICDSDAIASCLECLASNRALLASMSEAARIRSDYGSLNAYRERLLEALELK